MTDYNDGAVPVSIVADHLSYDAETGVFTSKTNRRNVMIGGTVGTKDRQGYIVTTIFKKPVKLHRAAWALTYGNWPSGQIDHINGDKADNRICNLREVTNVQNKQNTGKPASNTSGIMGVSFHKKSGKWAANIKVDGSSRYLGIYDRKSDAGAAYAAAKAKLHPFSSGDQR